MRHQKFKALLISSFNADIFKGYLNNDEEPPLVEASAAPFAQVLPVLTDKDHESWKDVPDIVVIWTQPESVIESFRRLLNYEQVMTHKLLEEVDGYCDYLKALPDEIKCAFVPKWDVPAHSRGYGILDMRSPVGIEDAILRMNLRLSENLSNRTNIYVLDTKRWFEAAGKNGFNPKLWYMAKVPFGNEVFREAAKDIKTGLNALLGNARKIIMLDLDDTLWGGIAADVGWKGIRLGGHDFIGEAYLDFQTALKALTNRGILLGVVSKNDEAIALEVMDKCPEMAIKQKDLAGWRINWEDKARNISDLAKELNLGLQSVVFIDDSPVERARVREALPAVLVPEMPDDPVMYKKVLMSLSCFDTISISKEDAERSRMYTDERSRRKLKEQIPSVDEWLKSLNIKVSVEELGEINLHRASQLLNKTNQMNLATRRMTEKELMDWAGGPGRKTWVFRVSDKFGDSGLTGMISMEKKGAIGKIVDFILSCRVIGRRVEEAMVYTAISNARSMGVAEVVAEYLPTQKNKPCLEFWAKSGFSNKDGFNVFKWRVEKKYPLPACINMESSANGT